MPWRLLIGPDSSTPGWIPLQPNRPSAASRTAAGSSSSTSQPPKSQERRGSPGDIFSIGLQVGGDGTVSDAIVGSPAFQAGISSGMKVIGVNGRVFTPDVLEDAIKAAKDSSQPISLLVVSDDYIRTCTVNYHGGEQYPHLVRVSDQPDYLDDLIKPRAPTQ